MRGLRFLGGREVSGAAAGGETVVLFGLGEQCGVRARDGGICHG
jgi:hypothetical protein